MIAIDFRNLYYDGTNTGTIIAKLELEPNGKYYVLKKIFWNIAIPTNCFQKYPWDIGTQMFGYNEDISRIGAYLFDLSQVDKKAAKKAIQTIFEGVK